jgi:hypothetical protein
MVVKMYFIIIVWARLGAYVCVNRHLIMVVLSGNVTVPDTIVSAISRIPTSVSPPNRLVRRVVTMLP